MVFVHCRYILAEHNIGFVSIYIDSIKTILELPPLISYKLTFDILYCLSNFLLLVNFGYILQNIFARLQYLSGYRWHWHVSCSYRTLIQGLNNWLFDLQEVNHFIICFPIFLDYIKPLLVLVLLLKRNPDGFSLGLCWVSWNEYKRVLIIIISLAKHHRGISQINRVFILLFLFTSLIGKNAVRYYSIPFHPGGLSFKHYVSFNIWSLNFRQLMHVPKIKVWKAIGTIHFIFENKV